MANKTELVNEFATTFTQMLKNVAIVKPKSIIGKKISQIETALTTYSVKQVSIKLFILHLIPYKTHIDNYDDSFIDKINWKQKSNGSKKILKVMKELIKLWKTFNKTNKIIFFKYVQVLSVSAYDYLVILDEENKMKDAKMLQSNNMKRYR